MSASDAISDFIAYMEANGVEPAEPIAHELSSGDLIRFQCKGDRKGRKNGWAILYLDARPAGAFGNHKASSGTLKWKSGENGPALTKEEREALQREWNEAREAREARRRDAHEQAAIDASDIWRRAQAASADHPYLVAKGIAGRELRQDGDTLLVPMTDEKGEIWNLQRIKSDGTKRFLHGGRIDELFCLIGDVTAETTQAVFCEGYATGSTIHRAIGCPVIVAFNTSNLIKVARLWARNIPDLDYTVFADDDEKTAREIEARSGIYKNPGIEAAEAAARKIGAKVAYPLGQPQAWGAA